MKSEVREALAQMIHFLDYVEDIRPQWGVCSPTLAPEIMDMLQKKSLQARKAIMYLYKEDV